jgi:hypothetical protein
MATAEPLLSGSNQATLGVSLDATTSAYQVTPVIGVLIGPPVAGVPVPTRPLPAQGFNASVALRNHTSQDIPVALRVMGVSGDRFAFRVYNSAGQLVWDSTGGINTPALVMLASLKAGKAWRQTAFVPIFINGIPLPAGTYSLSISLLGTPEFSTTTFFQVNHPIAVN